MVITDGMHNGDGNIGTFLLHGGNDRSDGQTDGRTDCNCDAHHWRKHAMCVRIGAVFLRFSQLLLTNYLPCLVVCTPTMNKSLIHNNIHWSKPNISPLHFLGLRTWHQGWMIFSKISKYRKYHKISWYFLYFWNFRYFRYFRYFPENENFQ